MRKKRAKLPQGGQAYLEIYIEEDGKAFLSHLTHDSLSVVGKISRNKIKDINLYCG